MKKTILLCTMLIASGLYGHKSMAAGTHEAQVATYSAENLETKTDRFGIMVLLPNGGSLMGPTDLNSQLPPNVEFVYAYLNNHRQYVNVLKIRYRTLEEYHETMKEMSEKLEQHLRNIKITNYQIVFYPHI